MIKWTRLKKILSENDGKETWYPVSIYFKISQFPQFTLFTCESPTTRLGQVELDQTGFISKGKLSGKGKSFCKKIEITKT